MKNIDHYIIIKWKDEVNKKEELKNEIYSSFLKLGPLYQVRVYNNLDKRLNGFHLMIVIKMDYENLNKYKESDIHLNFKKKYSSLIDEKIIFDCEV